MTKLSLVKSIALVNSILGVIPVAMISFYFYCIDGNRLVDGIAYGENYERSAGEPMWVFSILLTAFVSVIGSILAIFLFKKTNEKKYLTLSFLGGVLIYWLTFLKVKKIKIGNKIFSIFALFIPVLSLSALGFAAKEASNAVQHSKYDEPSDGAYYEDPSFSLDPLKPNVIDIFSDGLDLNCFNEVMNEEMWNKLADFVFYKKFVTSGYFTDTSVGELLMGDDKYLDGKKYSGKSRLYKFGDEASFNDYEQQNFVGNITFSSKEPQTFEQVWSGDWRHFKEIYPSVNITNWTLANNLLGYRDVYKYAPEYAPYKAFVEKAHAGKKASYSYLTDHITHSPDHLNENGEFTIYGSRLKSFKALANFLIELRDKLSSIVDEDNPDINAFDNTTIFIYGDHGSHRLDNVAYNSLPKNGINSSKNISALFIKPLNTKINRFAIEKPKNIVSNREIWAPFVRRIIGEAVENKRSPISFIDSNKNFNEGRIFETTDRTPLQHIGDSYLRSYFNYYTHFEGDILKSISDNEVSAFGVSKGINGWYQKDSNDSLILNREVAWK